ncbi:MAG: hypothetical protein V7K32_02040 [Nostoc sp.]
MVVFWRLSPRFRAITPLSKLFIPALIAAFAHTCYFQVRKKKLPNSYGHWLAVGSVKQQCLSKNLTRLTKVEA